MLSFYLKRQHFTQASLFIFGQRTNVTVLPVGLNTLSRSKLPTILYFWCFVEKAYKYIPYIPRKLKFLCAICLEFLDPLVYFIKGRGLVQNYKLSKKILLLIRKKSGKVICYYLGPRYVNLNEIKPTTMILVSLPSEF